MSNYIEKIDKTRLPVVVLRGVVVFPQNSVSLEIAGKAAIAALDAAAKNGGVACFVMLRDVDGNKPLADSLFEVGTLAKIKQTIRVDDKTKRVIIEGTSRASIVSCEKRDGVLWGDLLVKYTHTDDNGGIRGEAYMREAVEAFEQMVKFLPKLSGEVSLTVKSISSIGLLADFIACHVLVRPKDKQAVLEEFDQMARIKRLIMIMYEEQQVLETEAMIHDKVQERLNRNQRDYVLREQLKTIKAELGDDASSEVDEYYERIRAAKLPEELELRLNKEVARMAKSPFGSAEAAVSRNWLDTLLEFPWTKLSRDKSDIARARKILDNDHDGLEKVKERIIEFLAVKKLTPDLKTQIICLVGPPGVGKTSIGASIARALGRRYVRVSLGGVRDEAEIRGHRKTYIGAMPGRITAAISQAKVRNPMILLDEIDKLGQSHNGDPASALLEVLDGEQNKSFRDHYMELPIDLSECLFIATANTLETIPRPLIDRMEVIEMKTYTRHEKLSIAKNHIVAKQIKRCGLTKRQLKLSDDAIFEIIDFYTREAGVRNLERQIGAICRKAAARLVENETLKYISVTEANVKDFLGARTLRLDRIFDADLVGVVNGLAYTEVGGDMLRLEVLPLEGSGKLELTGSLGDVMKESAKIALSFVRSRAYTLGIDPDFYKNRDLHIHVPEGATPKDGPSAGVTMVTAIASALSGLPVRRDIAMTGEVTLTGRVLAIGGLREKTLAAYQAGVRRVLIPEENLPDLEEIDPIVRESLEFIPVKTADEVLEAALVRTNCAEGIFAGITKVENIGEVGAVCR